MRRPILIVVSVLVLAGSLGAAWLGGRDLPPRFNAAVPEAAGRAVAGEAARLHGSGGGKIIVFTRDTTAFAQPAHDALLRGLQRGLASAGIEVADTRLIALDPLRPMQVPPGDFFEAIRRAGPADVIVSLMGPPFLTEEQRAGLGGARPRVVAFWPGGAGEYGALDSLFADGLLHAAVISRAPKAPLAAETFESLYQVVNAPAGGRKP